MHHRFDDSPDDYDMDMDQRTRMLGRGGRIILLGDGTEILTGHSHDHDGDVDMDDRGEAEETFTEENDEEIASKDQAKSNGGEQQRSQREETPAPSSNDMSQKVEESKQRLVSSDQKPEDPATKPVVDSAGSSESATTEAK